GAHVTAAPAEWTQQFPEFVMAGAAQLPSLLMAIGYFYGQRQNTLFAGVQMSAVLLGNLCILVPEVLDEGVVLVPPDAAVPGLGHILQCPRAGNGLPYFERV